MKIKWQAAGRFGGSIKDEDWLLLKEFVETHNIQRVAEFGSGRSTILMDALGLSVVSYETEPDLFNENMRFLKRSFVVWWNGETANLPINCELVFIDGPAGGENRENAYILASQSNAKFIACHDYQRPYESKWREKWLNDWEYLVSGRFTAIYGRILQKS
jgi:hypothetical protein